MGGPQGNAPFSMQGLAPSIPSNQLPPEVLTGVTASAQKIGEMLDSFAQITPDKASMLAMMKDMLQQYLAELMTAGAGAISPTASGSAFPGGGMDRGIAGPGSV
jgi:hypothetical protein